ncbi:hypothetical protein AB4189_27195, partial [Vibrio sp. 10N.286.49.E1]|uniref:hypothetical protein n=1 Tax=Vibrio sp. 10N.286.49.E1 TaxID=3229702 RepID=UPI00354B782E
MNAEEYREWKVSMRGKGTALGYTNQPWGSNFNQSCLPVSMLLLKEVVKTFPTAKVVLGDLLEGKGSTLSSDEIRLIQSFSSSPCPVVKPSFHAWIQIDSTRILDVVGPAFHGIGISYFDELNASGYGMYHHK